MVMTFGFELGLTMHVMLYNGKFLWGPIFNKSVNKGQCSKFCGHQYRCVITPVLIILIVILFNWLCI